MKDLMRVIPAHASRDGAGVAIQRVAGFDVPGMDPILMIDELRSEHREDFAAGFPAHPHRGMQTLTYMKHGGIIHEDSEGNRGEIRGGGAQYMSAGRGIIHSEMPTQDSSGLHGFQLWFNLPARQKMQAPRYRDLAVDQLVSAENESVRVTAISGEWAIEGLPDVQGPLEELEPQASMLDLNLAATASTSLGAVESETLMAYIYDGSVSHDGKDYGQRNLLLFRAGSSPSLKAGSEGAAMLVLRGTPIGEPVVHYGPFVMNTRQEIEEAVRDYQNGRLVA